MWYFLLFQGKPFVHVKNRVVLLCIFTLFCNFTAYKYLTLFHWLKVKTGHEDCTSFLLTNVQNIQCSLFMHNHTFHPTLCQTYTIGLMATIKSNWVTASYLCTLICASYLCFQSSKVHSKVLKLVKCIYAASRKQIKCTNETTHGYYGPLQSQMQFTCNARSEGWTWLRYELIGSSILLFVQSLEWNANISYCISQFKGCGYHRAAQHLFKNRLEIDNPVGKIFAQNDYKNM